jgi:hypothetical protein
MNISQAYLKSENFNTENIENTELRVLYVLCV